MHKNSDKLFKRYLRHELCKPLKLSIAKFIQCIRELVSYLPYFPNHLAVFHNDEIVDIIYQALLYDWQDTVSLLNIDLPDVSVDDFEEYLERVETVEKIRNQLIQGLLSDSNLSEERTRKCKQERNQIYIY